MGHFERKNKLEDKQTRSNKEQDQKASTVVTQETKIQVISSNNKLKMGLWNLLFGPNHAAEEYSWNQATKRNKSANTDELLNITIPKIQIQ